jgi:hypothetical protein
VIETAAALEATAVAQFLKASRWTYPLVNAGHILGIALLVGAVVPMDVASCAGGRWRRWGSCGRGALRGSFWPWPAARSSSSRRRRSMCEAHGSSRRWGSWRSRSLNAAAHARLDRFPPRQRRQAAIASLALWPTALILGRMIAYG